MPMQQAVPLQNQQTTGGFGWQDFVTTYSPQVYITAGINLENGWDLQFRFISGISFWCHFQVECETLGEYSTLRNQQLQ